MCSRSRVTLVAKANDCLSLSFRSIICLVSIAFRMRRVTSWPRCKTRFAKEWSTFFDRFTRQHLRRSRKRLLNSSSSLLGPRSSWIVVDDGLWWSGWNHRAKVRTPRALMTGIAVFEHVLVCDGESRAVLVFDCLL